MSHQSELIEKDINAYLAQHERKDLLRFLTCGSVDDGKSTLIGRLLYDSKLIYEDQLAAIKKDSELHGTTGTDFDPAMLTDGLKAEREQGITIDVAYRYFSTAKRKFIIADTPGHEQYTRNMATGASTCDLAIILIDARHGVVTQTRRHSFIVSLLGIKHVVVAVNKMDLVDFSRETYDQIVSDYTDFSAKLEIPDMTFIPLSALNGDNVVDRSDNTPWYKGSPLLNFLENVPIASDRNLIDLRFPVQYVSRPDLNFRGFSGTVASGTVRTGDELVVLPGGQSSRVKQLFEAGDETNEVPAWRPGTIVLEDEIDISRGDMLVHRHNQPHVGRTFEAMFVWMTDEPLREGGSYLVKHASKTTPAIVSELRYQIDVNTLHRNDAGQLNLNEIGRCVVETAIPIAYDAYKMNRHTGAFILIDRLTNNTVGAGMILEQDPNDGALNTRLHTERHTSAVTPDERIAKLGAKPATIWLTGLTGSGKSTIAYALERRLFDNGILSHVLDGRNARLGLNVDLNFDADDRSENLRRAAEVAKLFNNAGLISICAFLSPSAENRSNARSIVGEDRFIEIHLSAPLETCRDRAADSYAKAESGEIKRFPGVSAEYQAPEAPTITLPTHEIDADTAVDRIMQYLIEKHFIQ